jgi:uncharacterized membrane protein required for colicin V production
MEKPNSVTPRNQILSRSRLARFWQFLGCLIGLARIFGVFEYIRFYLWAMVPLALDNGD